MCGQNFETSQEKENQAWNKNPWKSSWGYEHYYPFGGCQGSSIENTGTNFWTCQQHWLQTGKYGIVFQNLCSTFGQILIYEVKLEELKPKVIHE